MENKIYGYIRVSSRDQNEDRQVIALRECEEEVIAQWSQGNISGRAAARMLGVSSGLFFKWVRAERIELDDGEIISS